MLTVLSTLGRYTTRDGDPLPFIVQKTDGGFMYSTTDLAAVRQRVDEEGADRVLYVTDSGQATHFEQVFQVAQKAGFLKGGTSLEHVPFGLVLGEDGKKFKTRSGDTVRLMDLLDEAISRTTADVRARVESEGREEGDEFVDATARAVGIGAVKYAAPPRALTTLPRPVLSPRCPAPLLSIADDPPAMCAAGTPTLS